MKAFFDAIGRFFRSLFGGGHEEVIETPPPIIDETEETPASDPTETIPPEEDPTPAPETPPVVTTIQDSPQVTPADSPAASGSFLVLKRDPAEGAQISGKLYLDGEFCCFTLEAADKHVPAGSYPLALRTKGGLHATYGYKYGDMHKGILQLESAENEFIFIRSGNNALDAEGGIVVGNSLENGASGKEVWNSDDAYKKLYPPVAEKLAAGEGISLEIKG